MALEDQAQAQCRPVPHLPTKFHCPSQVMDARHHILHGRKCILEYDLSIEYMLLLLQVVSGVPQTLVFLPSPSCLVYSQLTVPS